MLTKNQSVSVLKRVFKRQQSATLEEMFSILETRSRMSVFRRLCEIGYHSSYTHAGRYYTLLHIPHFNSDGLWHCDDVGFSAHGTLKNTVVHFVECAAIAQTQNDLEIRLKVRVQNTLLELVRLQKASRERVDGNYVYASADAKKARLQIRRYQELRKGQARRESMVPEWMIMEVLVEAIRENDSQINVIDLAARLTQRGRDITPCQVEQVFIECGLKKTVALR